MSSPEFEYLVDVAMNDDSLSMFVLGCYHEWSAEVGCLESRL